MSVVRMVGAHRVMAGALRADGLDSEPYALLVTRRGAAVGKGYYPSVGALADVVDLADLSPGS